MLGQFAKAHSRLIHARLLGAITSGNRLTFGKLIATIDNYHELLGIALGALARTGICADAEAAQEMIGFSPEL